MWVTMVVVVMAVVLLFARGEAVVVDRLVFHMMMTERWAEGL